jgi:hypothetical protein
VQAGDIGGIVGSFNTTEAATLPPLMEILLGSNHGGVIDAQAVEQLPVVGSHPAGRQQQSARYHKFAVLHGITRVPGTPVVILVRITARVFTVPYRLPGGRSLPPLECKPAVHGC